MMAPFVRRTWSPCGKTPWLYQKTRSHKKVSIIAALCIPPRRSHLHLFFRLHPDTNINAHLVVAFLRNLLKELPGPIIIVWDRSVPHRSKKVQTLRKNNPRLHLSFLPPYAPELNPVEYVWSYSKTNPLANATDMDVAALTTRTRRSVQSVQKKPYLLRSFIGASGLSLRLR
jgi:putative transposase